MARKPLIQDSLAGKEVKYETYYKNRIERFLKGLGTRKEKPDPRKEELKKLCQ